VPKKKQSLFKKPKHKKYAKIVSFKNPTEARKSAKIMNKEFNSSKTRSKKLRVARATQYASNRAFATAKKKNLSLKERREFKEIGRIYDNAAEKMWKNINKKNEVKSNDKK